MKSQFETIEDNAFKLNNFIQINLAGLFNNRALPSDEEFTAWGKLYSKKYREIMDRHPEYLALYAQDPEEALDKISKELYETE